MSETRNRYADIVNIMMHVSGKTRAELANCLGVNYNTFTSIARSRSEKCRTFDISEIVKLADFCGFDLILERNGVKINLVQYVNDRNEEKEDEDDNN